MNGEGANRDDERITHEKQAAHQHRAVSGRHYSGFVREDA
jgi:hypothetical protein